MKMKSKNMKYNVKRAAYKLVAAVAIFAFSGLLEAKVTPGLMKKVDVAKMNAWVDSTMSTMTQREKIAQLMLVTFRPTDTPQVRSRLDAFVGKHRIGGLLFSKGSCIEEAKVINYAQSISKIPLMITLDGEWGLSMRMPEAPLFPRNMVLGAITDERLLYEYGAEVARECREVGIHVNFAPVLDVNDNPKNPVIGTRSFGEVPERVASLGIAYSKGLEDNGVLATAKHFPGHGSTSTDSHKVLPTVNKSMQELNICELLPFRQYTDAGLSGVMVAHLSIPAIDNSGTPTSLSAKANALLRENVGFDGLIFTDALTMKGANTKGSTAVKALLAGDDMLLSLPEPEKQIGYVVDAIKKGELSAELIDEKCRKVLRYKYALNIHNTEKVKIEGLVSRVATPEAAALIRRLWAAAMTVVKNENNVWPVKDLEKKKIAVVTMGDSLGIKSQFQRRCAMYAKVDSYNFVAGGNISALQSKLKEGNYDMVIVGVHKNSEAYRLALSSLVKNVENVSVAMFVNPYKIAPFASSIKASAAMLVAYDNNEIAQDCAAQTIFGGNAASATLPVTIEGVAKAGHGISYDAFRLGYALPEEVGVDSKLLTKVDSIAKYGLEEGAFTGLQVLVARHGKVICNKWYGYTEQGKNRKKVDYNTIFDLASVSKATGTISGIMKCYDEGKFQLDSKISEFVKPLKGTDKESITMRDLLYHETGIPASLNMFEMMFDPNTYDGKLVTPRRRGANTIKISNGAYGHNGAKLRKDILSRTKNKKFNTPVARNLYVGSITRDSIMQRIYDAPLRDNKRFLYSCLNFSLLMQAEESMTGIKHDEYVRDQVFAPLGAYRTGYCPQDWSDISDIVTTENDTYLRREMVKGHVHDEMADFMGGVSGNAGLFSNANDLAKLFQMWLNGGEYGGDRFLKKETVDLFLTSKSENSRRGLGFDKPDVEDVEKSPCCEAAPAEVIGHTGFTGTGYWVDPKNDLIYIFLSNRVHPTRSNKAFTKVAARSGIQAVIYESLLD